jgi:hypothetical protein
MPRKSLPPPSIFCLGGKGGRKGAKSNYWARKPMRMLGYLIMPNQGRKRGRKRDRSDIGKIGKVR